MKSYGLNRLNIILLSLVALIIMACGGSSTGSSGNALDKHMAVRYTNNAPIAVNITDPTGSTSIVPANGSSGTLIELVLPSTSTTSTWNFDITHTDGSAITTVSYTWTYPTANSNSGLSITLGSDYSTSVGPTP